MENVITRKNTQLFHTNGVIDLKLAFDEIRREEIFKMFKNKRKVKTI